MAGKQENSAASKGEDTIKDLSQRVSNLSLKSKPKKTGAKNVEEKTDSDGNAFQHGAQTPEQIRVSYAARPKVVQKLFSSPEGTKKPVELPEKKDGEWLKEHPWEKEIPNRQKQMIDTVNMSKVYTVTDNWLKSGRVNLGKIYSHLPEYIEEMKGLSIRQELERTLKFSLLTAIDFKMKPPPHVLEIIEKNKKVVPTDKPSLPVGYNSFKAFSLIQQQQNIQPSKNNYWYLDCEYMLTMYLPDNSSQWFDIHDQVGKRIKAINSKKSDKRWIFIPSFRRAKIALLDWPPDDIVTSESTIRILVVRPSEFDEYVKYCGHQFPVICLPQDEIGAGYPRYWIQKIALRLKLQFIWMIDDSVECFYEYHRTCRPPFRKDKDGKWRRNYRDYRRRKFGLVFERIEDFVKEADDSDNPIAAMSPRRWNPKCRPHEPFVRKPPQGAVYLNLRALSDKNVYYRPELKFLEDMIFGYECEEKGLKVYMDNRIHFQDHNWKNTGARSPSVKGK